MTLVAGVDSSTQSCKVVIRDAETGALVREGRASHPDGTSCHPDRWWEALLEAVEQAGGLADVAAVAVGGQQHGMVALDADGAVLHDALLWNDTRSAPEAEQLTEALGGPAAWAEAVGLVPVASFTVTKVAWLARHEPELAARLAAVCLPHDWLTWRLAGGGPGTGTLDRLVTDRGDASGTGYYDPRGAGYRRDLLALALGDADAAERLVLPTVLGPAAPAGRTAVPGLTEGALLGPGTGDNMAAALGLGARPGDVVVSIGTSGVVSVVTDVPSADVTGTVAGFADASGNYLPLVCTLNAARVLDATARLLGVDHDRLADLALQAPAGADGLVLVPYLEGERTPNLPLATGAVHGLTLASATPAHLARAAVEGLLCGLADGLQAIRDQGVGVQRVMLVGGGARSHAVRAIAPAVLGVPVVVPSPGEYVADGAARQAAWVLSGAAEAPAWASDGSETFEAVPTPAVRARYGEVSALVAPRAGA